MTPIQNSVSNMALAIVVSSVIFINVMIFGSMYLIQSMILS